MGENINLLNELCDGLSEDHASGKKDRTDGHHASGCSGIVRGKQCGACMRKSYFDITGEKETNDTSEGAKLKMRIGNVLHKDFQEILIKKHPDMICEKLHSLKIDGLVLPLVGSPDGIIPSLNTGMEIKTVYGKNQWWEIENIGARAEAIMQCQCYIKLTGVPVWQIMYIDRGDGMRKKFDVSWQPEIWDSMVIRWKKLEDFLKNQEVPPREYNDDQWQCSIKNGRSYCSYSNRCGVVPLPEKVKKSKKGE